MMQNKRLPFQNLGTRAWLNLAMAALVMLYLAQIIWTLKTEVPLSRSIGLDFRAIWSAGYIANIYGYADIYNLNILTQIQRQFIPLSNHVGVFEAVPVPFLPIFIPIFQFFAFFPAYTGFYLWTFFNLAGFFLYIQFFLKKLEVQEWKRLALMGLLTFPSFSNLFWGQINLFVFVCVGEFIRKIIDKHEIQAGLWLGGLILKPQLMILIVPALLLQRKWKLLGGISVTVLIAIFSSLLLGKVSSLINLFNLLVKYVPGIASNAEENMMNWRMVGERLSSFLPTPVSWGIAAFGLSATVIATYLLWRKQLSLSSPLFLITFTGTLAASLAATWHSHVHMGIVLIPPILWLYSRRIFPDKLFVWWIFGIPLITLILPIPIKLLNLDRFSALPALPGFIMLVFNLKILVWAMRVNRNKIFEEQEQIINLHKI